MHFLRIQFIAEYCLKRKLSVPSVQKLPKAGMKYLSVAEKHAAAKTISGLLSNGRATTREGYSVYNKIFDYDAVVKGKPCKMVMTSVSGHLLNYAFASYCRNWRSVAPETLFDAPVQKICPDDYMPIKRTLEREIRGCHGLIIWTDCDREGENIGFEIVEVCRAVKPRIVVYRANFSEITSASVKRALQNLTEPDKCQSDAVDVRSELDLRTGAVITRLQTLRLQQSFPDNFSNHLISYGSCQIPTLGFVVERYKEVEAFVSEPFWKIAVTHTIDDLTVHFNWARNRLFDKQECEDFLLLCLASPNATVQSVVVKPKNKWRPQPMDTVEMEKLGSRKLKLTAKETMSIAEKLYTQGIISYPRTETNQFSKEIDLKALVQLQADHGEWGSFATRVLEWGPNPRNGNKSDQAHPPIHPTKLVTSLQGNEARVYELICRHFLATVSKDAVGSETIVRIKINGEEFSANGLCIHERNYLDVYVYDKWNAKQIHNYKQGDIFEPTNISMEEGATTPPALLTEADLIALMEKHGIGTDATHAEHINTIKERGYVGVVDNGFLIPGVIGMGLCEAYDAMRLELARPILRAQFEDDLKKICLGQKIPADVIREQIAIYKQAYLVLKEKINCLDEKLSLRLGTSAAQPSTDGQIDGTRNPGQHSIENGQFAQQLFLCPKCKQAPLALKQKNNRSGYFIGCLNFPDCKNCIWLPDEITEPVVLNQDNSSCPKCGPEFHLLKFKLSTPYLKTLFKTQSGWYKTCIRCDHQFQETFNINLDTVRNVGGIVSNSNVATMAPSLSRGRNGSASENRNNPDSPPQNRNEQRKKKTTTNVINDSLVPTNADEMLSNQFLHDNDELLRCFDEAFDEETTTTAVNNEQRSSQHTLNLSEVFADDDDDIFRDCDIPSANTVHTESTTTQSYNRSNSRPHQNLTNNDATVTRMASLDFDRPGTSQSTRKRTATWGSSTDNDKQQKRNNSNSTRPNSNNQETTVNCNCGKAAIRYTVRKEGPNTGRHFYKCSTCQFFQWVVETEGPISSNQTRTNTQPRKCSLCRQPGHTKNKCPRNN